jgi:hypothetical protein
MKEKKGKNFIYISDQNDTTNSTFACFGFELINIHLESSYKPDSFLARASEWNRQFLNAISLNPVDCTAMCKIRKEKNRNESGSKPLLRIAVLFMVRPVKGSDPLSDAENLLADVDMLFRPVNGFHANTFIFVPIASRRHLNDFIRQPARGKTYEYIRKPVYYKRNTTTIGYRTRKNLPDTIDFIPQFFAPDYFSLGNVAGRLALLNGYSELSFSVTPMSLTVPEIQELKYYKKNYRLMEESFTTDEKEIYFKQLDNLFDDNTNRFVFRVSLFVDKAADAGRALHNAISDAFFGNIPSVEFKEIAFAKSMDFFEPVNGEKRNCCLYSRELLQDTFRLPSSSNLPVTWFAQHSDVITYFPEEMPEDGILLGVKNIPYQQMEVRIRAQDLARHMYILGQTGVGKTTLLKTMILDQINRSEGMCVVDPHGDLVSALIDQIPEHRKQDVIEFDPTQNKEDIRINMLEYDHDFPEQKSLIFNELMRQFDEIYNMKEAGGPVFEQYLKNGMWLIMESGGTLFDLFRLFHDLDYRKQLVLESRQQDVVMFFNTAERAFGEMSMGNVANYITSKLNRYVQDGFIGPILSERKSTIRFREVIDSGKIFLVRLPKGRIGSDGVKFIGRLLFNKFVMAAFTRENIPVAQRQPYYLYIDEFQNFTTRDVETALSETRKYGLSLILANQTLSQLSPDLVRTILGNVGSQVFFRPGSFDIEVLSPYFKYDIGEKEMLGMRNFHAFARLLNQDMPMRPFIFETIVK